MLGRFILFYFLLGVIHLNIFDSSKHLFLSIDSLSWMEANFLKQNPCMSSWPAVFICGNFCVYLWVNQSVSSPHGFLWLLLSRFYVVCPFGFSFIFSLFSLLFYRQGIDYTSAVGQVFTNEASSLLWVVKRNNWGRDPGGWATRNPITKVAVWSTTLNFGSKNPY